MNSTASLQSAAVPEADMKSKDSKKHSALNAILRDRYLFLLAFPGLAFFILFKLVPMFGISVAFQDYSPVLGLTKSPWVGFANFEFFFSSSDFWLLFRNTLSINLINLVLCFPAPILVALMLNELKNMAFKRSVQSIIYIPHFFSWVIVYMLTYLLFAKGSGVINELIAEGGGTKVDALTNPGNFWLVLALQNLWKETGWGTILYLAAIVGIDQQMYEAAKIDGASKFQMMFKITLPSLFPLIVTLLIFRVGHILSVGFEQIFLMSNGAVSDVADVFPLYAYRMGLQQGQFSLSTAVGLFESIVNLILILITNKAAHLMGQEGIF